MRRLDPIEVEETAALIDFVAVCRNYASELAINEVTMRTYSDLHHYVERGTAAKPWSNRFATVMSVCARSATSRSRW